ncbi:inositol hexakisphosphate kinase 3 [Microcaecilia unicolor]|uniref:Kinase n=1 Tax=Microcaecilia unicolor TaxID=1415580 RepID=A0A6P7ZJ42_9AMPH|nr:inositol hexakisphosphate kinase 3 [Microcaecilia unicolor]XP_030077603.1 inositol hexakisphosphate kinase 3 [Microcaecilia unicolor]XP_030077604.1 inositol hexakisphosphate kinase 3 [Microcaecilia unicolor]
MVVQDSRDMIDPRKGVLLEPFHHQVGGHMSMMKYNEHTVCKPLVSQEQCFYESLPKEMKCFTPQYKGVVSVFLRKDSRGRLGLIASPQAEGLTSFDMGTESSLSIWSKLKWEKPGCGEGSLTRWKKLKKATINESCSGNALLRAEVHFQTEVSCYMEGSTRTSSERISYNPWGLQCHKEQLTRMSSECHENTLHRFLLLENVASKFKYPCILDLKMGTRQHGDDATEEKKARHMKKCAQSTSSSLGVRICGMQVYHADKGHFLCKDKYYGRKLSADGFKQALYHFLHNGKHLRKDLVEPILFQLRALKSVIEGQSSYRFYSSSLLIVYDGQEQVDHKVTSDHQGCIQKNGCTASYIVNSLPKVDVRMIDFAHTTYKDLRGNQTSYDGPDQGYIFGLDNLIQILQNIQAGE